MALRTSLKIRPTDISDAFVGSLCKSLDSDRSGTVDVKELVEFIGVSLPPLASPKPPRSPSYRRSAGGGGAKGTPVAARF
jgi:hypothetical protein